MRTKYRGLQGETGLGRNTYQLPLSKKRKGDGQEKVSARCKNLNTLLPLLNKDNNYITKKKKKSISCHQ